MNKNYIEEHVLGFYYAGNNPKHRFKSWDYCYDYFQELKDNPSKFNSNPDDACVNLGFYLASWGMYRGSGFLLKRSYKIHEIPIRELLESNYDSLWNIDFMSQSQNCIVDSIMDLAISLRDIYRNNISDTLISKILLGTMGCTPAFDRLFKDGCRKHNVRPFSNLSIKSMNRMIEFYKANAKVFSSINETIKEERGLYYPQMKLIDMLFWSVGSNKNYNAID